MNTSDNHHCRCFKILPNDISKCKEKLQEIGFKLQIPGEEDHGQVVGLVWRVKEVLQIHFKIMSDGLIEGEMEPPTAYPKEHLETKFSYPAHFGIQALLQSMNIQYYTINPIPSTCIEPEIQEPDDPTHAAIYALIVFAAILIGLILSRK